MISSEDTYNFKVSSAVSRSQMSGARDNNNTAKLRGTPQLIRGGFSAGTPVVHTSAYGSYMSQTVAKHQIKTEQTQPNDGLAAAAVGAADDKKGQTVRAQTSLQRKNIKQRPRSSKAIIESDDRALTTSAMGRGTSVQQDYSQYYDMSRKVMATEEDQEQEGVVGVSPLKKQKRYLQMLESSSNNINQNTNTNDTPTNLKNVSFHAPPSSAHVDSSSSPKQTNGSSRQGVQSGRGFREISPTSKLVSGGGSALARTMPKNSVIQNHQSTLLPRIGAAHANNNNSVEMNANGNVVTEEDKNYNNSSCMSGDLFSSPHLTQPNWKEIRNTSMYAGAKAKEDETRFILEQSVFAKMDREALVIRLSILETENKEVKCHNLHLSEKFKELLDEYRKYKEFMDGVDRKSLYQKHVQRLADLSKQFHDSKMTIEERNAFIKNLQEEMRLQSVELGRVTNILNNYDALKLAAIKEVEDAHRDLIASQNARVEELIKQNRKLVQLEVAFAELQEKLKEEARRFTSIIDKQEDRYRLLMQRWQESDKESQQIKDRMKIQELDQKKVLEKHALALAVLKDECNEKLRKVEMDSYAQILEKQEEIKKLNDRIDELTAENASLAASLQEARHTIQKLEMRKMSLLEKVDQEKLIEEEEQQETAKQVTELFQRLSSMERNVEDANALLNARINEVKNLQSEIEGLQRRNDEMALLRSQMEETHLQELNKVFGQQNELTQSLNTKILELKSHYEVEMDKMSSECSEKVKICSTTANDAQRQCQVLKVTYAQEIERKDNEIDFLKNKIYQEKQRLKEQVEDQYRDVVRDLERRADYLAKELDIQKWDIENGICEDLAVYNRNSRFWKKSREIRAQKFLTQNDDSAEEEDDDQRRSSSMSRSGHYSNNNSMNHHRQNSMKKSIATKKAAVISSSDRIRIRFQVVAKCARSFQEQQQKMDKMREQLEMYTGKKFTLLKGRSGNLTRSQQIKQSLSSSNQLSSQQSHFFDREESEKQLLRSIEEDMHELLEKRNEQLVVRIGELEEDLVQEQQTNAEMAAKYAKKEQELQENFKIKLKEKQVQIDLLNQSKTQIVFQKDILIEKQANKLEDMRRSHAEVTAAKASEYKDRQKMQKEFKEFEEKQVELVAELKKEIDNLIHEVNSKEARPEDKREMQRLIELINEKNHEITTLKYQSNLDKEQE